MIALLIEVAFRMGNGFAGAVKNGFRWIYIAGCGALAAMFLEEGWTGIMNMRINRAEGVLYGGIGGIALLFTLLINRKKA